MGIKTVSVKELEQLKQEQNETYILDVREAFEYQSEHIEGSSHLPLSKLARSAEDIDFKKDDTVYILCRSGNRSMQAAKILMKQGFNDVYNVEGGIQAWASAGYASVKGERKTWALDRQVRFFAGSLVCIGFLGSIWIEPKMIYLSAFIGAGLVFSALTNTCGMGMLLMKMPWNK